MKTTKLLILMIFLPILKSGVYAQSVEDTKTNPKIKTPTIHENSSAPSNYIGKWKNGNFHGKGEIHFSSGAVLKARWENGEVKGKARHIYPNGDIYIGKMKGTKRHGPGVLISSNGDKYIGRWENGYKQGIGKVRKANGDVQKGEWVHGKMICTINQSFLRKKRTLAPSFDVLVSLSMN